MEKLFTVEHFLSEGFENRLWLQFGKNRAKKINFKYQISYISNIEQNHRFLISSLWNCTIVSLMLYQWQNTIL
jgi:hypothetical protein